jgi:DNA-binding transcriptional ArsR family regulator
VILKITFNHMVKSSMKAQALHLDYVFRALSDSTRRSILRDVAKGEKTVGEIAQPYPVSLPAISKHLKVLEGAHLIRRQRRGSFQVVRINAAPMKEAEEWIAYYRHFWNNQLDALQDLLDREESH